MRSVSARKRWWPLVLLAGAAAVFLIAGSPASASGDPGTIAVCLTDSSGNALTPASDQVWYQANGGSIEYVGPVGASECREQTLTAGDSVKVWVEYNHTFSAQQVGTVPDNATTTFNFYTTDVTLTYAHDIALGGPTGDSAWFKQSSAPGSLELLPYGAPGSGPVHFRLDGTGGQPGRTTLTWPVATGPGATFAQTLFVVRLLDHNGNPLSGGTVDYYLGGWNDDVGQTDANGNYVLAPANDPNDSPSLSVAMNYNGTRNQQSHAQAVASIFTFQTTFVNVVIQAHDNSALDIPDNGSASYYAAGWHSITTENANNHYMVVTEMLPGTYSFAATYEGTRDQKTAAIAGSATTVYFHAALVTVALQDHNGNPLDLPDNGTGSYYAGGWHTMTTVDGTGNAVQAEMLPGTYSFAATYNGTREQTQYTVIEPNPNNHANAYQTVVFKTTLVNVVIQAHDNSALDIPDNGSASYYAAGWHSITTENANNHYMVVTEMLPGTYSFAATYEGTRNQKTAAIAGSATTVYFHAALVTVALQDHNGNPLDLPDNGTGSYYAGGWHTMTTVDGTGNAVQAEMLPGTYSFAATYNGTREQTQYTVIEPNPNNHANAYQTVSFKTVEVISTSGTATGYYAGGWQPFTSGDELLPGTYWFSFSSGPNAVYVVSAPSTTIS